MKLTRNENETTGINRTTADGNAATEMDQQGGEHASQIKDASRYVRFIRKNNYFTVKGKPIDVVFGVRQDGGQDIQSYRYPAQAWDADVAMAHSRSANGHFTAASGKAALMPSLEEKDIRVNQAAVEVIKTLIMAGKVNTVDRLVFEEGDRRQILGAEGKDWKGYAGIHLAEDVTKPEDTRMRYMTPIVKDGIVYLKPLLKACGDRNEDVAAAAKQLCETAGVEVGS
jgi:hypothetical protein